MRELHDGASDDLVALESLDPFQIHTFDDMVRAMGKTAFSGRSLGEAVDVLEAMAKDPDCLIVVTLSGAMTVAKMSMVLIRMIEAGMVHAVISTGALMAHGLSEAVGLTHYKVDPKVSDEEYFEKGYNRVYDTLEMEANLNRIDEFVRGELDKLDPSKPWCSEQICRHIGKALADMGDSPGILRSAYLHNVPVFVPAFTDSELGLDVATWMLRRTHKEHGNKPDFDPFEHAVAPPYNPFLDLLSYAKLVRTKKRLGIFTIGGGVPRNWAQQVAPFYDIVQHRLGVELEHPRFSYGVRICPEPVHWGGLSGCTYSEGVSWGKFVSPKEGGKFAEVYADATVAWPIIVRAALERLGKMPGQKGAHGKKKHEELAGSPIIILQITPYLGNPVELTFAFTGSPFIKVLATATDTALQPTYQQDTEYWAYTTAPTSFQQTMAMAFDYGMYTAAQADAFFSGFTTAFRVGETSSAAAWSDYSRVPYTPPTGAATYLYSAPDPDNSANRIGLALLINRSNALIGVVWYKIGDPTNGWVWQETNSPLSGLTWTYVGTSTDPNTILPSSSWYYIAQP